MILIFTFLNKLSVKIDGHKSALKELEKNQIIIKQEREKEAVLLVQVERAKRQWERTMDCVDDMILYLDLEMKIIRCNKAVTSFTERNYSELLGKKVVDLFHIPSLHEEFFSGRASEYLHKPSSQWFYVKQYIINNENKKSIGFVLTLHDLTEIKKAQAEIEHKNEEIIKNNTMLQSALDKISKLIQRVVEQEDFGVYFENKQIQKCYEVMRCGKKECPCYGQEPRRCWQISGTFCKGTVQGHFAQKYSSCIQCKHFQDTTSDPITMIGENFNNMMAILGAKNSELNEAYTELKKTQSHLLQHEKMASIGQLAAGVAHEINNPMGFISSNLGSLEKYSQRLTDFLEFQAKIIADIHNNKLDELLNKQKDKLHITHILGDIGDLIEESLDGCSRVKKIVDDLKGFSRIDQAGRQDSNINECIESSLNIVNNEIKYKAIIDSDFGKLSPIDCFPQQLNQVFMNLFINAAHAIEKEGVITIRTWQDEFINVTIADNGKGISPQNLTHIFEPFFTTKEVGKGTGLGLSIVYDIITKNHNGEIWAESEEGKGTTFLIKLPLLGASNGSSTE